LKIENENRRPETKRCTPTSLRETKQSIKKRPEAGVRG